MNSGYISVIAVELFHCMHLLSHVCTILNDELLPCSRAGPISLSSMSSHYSEHSARWVEQQGHSQTLWVATDMKTRQRKLDGERMNPSGSFTHWDASHMSCSLGPRSLYGPPCPRELPVMERITLCFEPRIVSWEWILRLSWIPRLRFMYSYSYNPDNYLERRYRRVVSSKRNLLSYRIQEPQSYSQNIINLAEKMMFFLTESCVCNNNIG